LLPIPFPEHLVEVPHYHHCGQRKKDIQTLKFLWRAVLPVPCPPEGQLGYWLNSHFFGDVCFGFREAGREYHKQFGKMTTIHVWKFASSVMNRVTQTLRERAIQ